MVLLVFVVLDSLCFVIENEKYFLPLRARHFRYVTIQQLVFIAGDNMMVAFFRELFVFLLVGCTELLQALFPLLQSFLDLLINVRLKLKYKKNLT